ncbi:putative cyclin-A3-1 [Castilleja foliolosa]|uniref:Cyclin-A3-1 n=1 Tax=Castilleja foliolosa TaxID=1961234 RepID=A0ABD3ECC7_9LAMI
MCEAYVSDIYEYLHNMEMEAKRRPLSDYLEKVQKDINASMRGVLVDWLVEVAEEYKLLSDTLYLTVSYIDRFLSTNVISRKKLQLLGVSSMLIASKYEEISPPHVEDFCYITDNTYTKEEVVKMEADVLKSLKFEIGNPTVKTFLRKFTRIAQENYDIENRPTNQIDNKSPIKQFTRIEKGASSEMELEDQESCVPPVSIAAQDSRDDLLPEKIVQTTRSHNKPPQDHIISLLKISFQLELRKMLV